MLKTPIVIYWIECVSFLCHYEISTWLVYCCWCWCCCCCCFSLFIH